MQRSSTRSGGTLAATALAGLALPGESEAAFVGEPPDFSDSSGAPTDLRTGAEIVDLSVVGDGVGGTSSGNISIGFDDDYILVSSPAGQPVDLEILLDWSPAVDTGVSFEVYDGTDFSSTLLFSQIFPSGSSPGSQLFTETLTSSTGTIGIVARTEGFENFASIDYDLQAVPEPGTAALLGLVGAASLVGRRLARPRAEID